MWFDKFRKTSAPHADNEFVYNEAVIVDISFDGMEDMGNAAEQRAVHELEEKIAGLLPPKSGIDGDEFGEGTATIYIYGPSADQIFSKIERELKTSIFNHINITLQYGLPDDPNTKDKKFTL